MCVTVDVIVTVTIVMSDDMFVVADCMPSFQLSIVVHVVREVFDKNLP